MKLLLDTHALIWFLEDDPKLSAAARVAIEEPVNERWVSIANGWEMAIKSQLGKLDLPQPFAVLFPGSLVAFHFPFCRFSRGICTAITRCHCITAILSTGCSSPRRWRTD